MTKPKPYRIEVRPCRWNEHMDALVELGPGLPRSGKPLCYVMKGDDRAVCLITSAAQLVEAGE